MPQELRNNIKPVELVPVEEISAAKNGSSIDTYIEASHHFDTVFVRAGVGGFGVDVASVKVKVEESDISNFGSGVTVAKGGEEVTLEENEQNTFQVERTKRYIRVVFTPVGVGSPSGTPGEDVALVYATGILCNWARPFPLL